MIEMKTIKKEIEEEVIHKANCSFCEKEFNKTNEWEGFGRLSCHFGYGSIFDDDCFNLEICDNCFLKKFYSLIGKEEFQRKGYCLDYLKRESQNER